MRGRILLGLVKGRATAAASSGCHLKPGRRNPHDGLGRGEHVFLAQRDRVQVRVFKRRNHASLDLFWNGRPRLLEDLGA